MLMVKAVLGGVGRLTASAVAHIRAAYAAQRRTAYMAQKQAACVTQRHTANAAPRRAAYVAGDRARYAPSALSCAIAHVVVGAVATMPALGAPLADAQAAVVSPTSPINVIPLPANVELRSGSFAIRAGTRIA